MRKYIFFILIIFLIAIGALFFSYKHFHGTVTSNKWHPPKVTIEASGSDSINKDFPFAVTISSEHPNVHISGVYIVFNAKASTALEKEDGKVFQDIYRERPIRYWPWRSIRRKPSPYMETFDYSIPFEEYLKKGLIKAGTLKGAVLVEYEYPVTDRYSVMWGRSYRTLTKRAKLDFNLDFNNKEKPDGAQEK